MSLHPPSYGPHGSIIPSNVPLRKRLSAKDAGGVLFRGIVLTVYSYDEARLRNPNIVPATLYCDVIIYSSRTNGRAAVLRECIVSQESASLYDGSIWRPRPTTTKFDGPLDVNKIRDFTQIDGDHVVVGFLDNDMASPIVLRSIAHPSSDHGKALPTGVNVPGNRLRLISSDQDVRLWRHHGTFFGAEADGSLIFDGSRGHEGKITETGTEQEFSASPAPNATIRLRSGAKFRVELVSDPDDPDETTKLIEFEINQNEVVVTLNGATNLRLAQSGDATTMQIGDGAVHVPIGEHLKALYDELKLRLDAFDLAYASHVHPMGPPPAPPTLLPLVPASISAPAWTSVPTIISSKVSLPDE